MRPPILLGLFALLLRAALAQTQPDVAEILKKVSETYKAASQYEFVADATVHEARTGRDVTSHMRFAFKAPDRYRVEGSMPGMSVGDLGPGEAIIVHDGSVVW